MSLGEKSAKGTPKITSFTSKLSDSLGLKRTISALSPEKDNLSSEKAHTAQDEPSTSNMDQQQQLPANGQSINY